MMSAVISHESRARTIWDVAIAALVIVGSVLIPFQIAFQRRATLGGSFLVYLIDVVCLCDILLNFRTTYRHQGAEVTDPKAIASRYRRGMFAVDLASTVPIDAVALLVAGHASVAGVQLGMLLRALRLLRVVRLQVLFRRWGRFVWTYSGYLRIAEFFVIVVLFLHWIACAWFLVPFMNGFPPDSWVVGEGLEDAGVATQYIRSLYWTIVTTTTVGYGDIAPTRNEEYVFAMAVMLLGATLYAFVIGNIASLLSNLDSAKVSFWSRVETTSQYLRSRRVPAELSERVRDYYEYIWVRFRGMDDRELLDDLPTSMRLEVVAHVAREMLDAIPLFEHCSRALRNILLHALQPQIYAPGDTLAYEGELGDAVYFIGRGEVEILSDGGRRSHGRLGGGEYFGDLSLLLGEQRTASVVALEYCDVFLLRGGDFERIRDGYPEFREVLKTVSADKSERISELILDGVVL